MRTVASAILHVRVRTEFQTQRKLQLALQPSCERVAPQQVTSNIALVWHSLSRLWSLSCWNPWRALALPLFWTLLAASSNAEPAGENDDFKKATQLIRDLSAVLT